MSPYGPGSALDINTSIANNHRFDCALIKALTARVGKTQKDKYFFFLDDLRRLAIVDSCDELVDNPIEEEGMWPKTSQNPDIMERTSNILIPSDSKSKLSKSCNVIRYS